MFLIFPIFANFVTHKKTHRIYGIDLYVVHFKQLVPPPEFIAYREKLWQELKADYDKWLAAQPQDPIKVTLPDGKQVEGQAWKTTPYDVAKGIRWVNH